MSWKVKHGDALAVLKTLPDESVQMCVTSPPYWGLRSYKTEPQVWGGEAGHAHEWSSEISIASGQSYGANASSTLTTGTTQARREEVQKEICQHIPVQTAVCVCGAWRGELGLEPTLELYVQHLVEVFREIKRVLRKDGTCWLNLGDSYAGSAQGWGHGKQYAGEKQRTNKGSLNQPLTASKIGFERPPNYISSRQPNGLKPKDLCGIPWRVAFALQADGWWFRSDIIWAKRNCMPESVTDRPTRSHEYLFLLSKSARYYYDAGAIKEPAIYSVEERKARAATTHKSMPTTERNGIRPAGFKDAAVFNGKHQDKQRGHSRRHAGFNDRWALMTKREQWAGFRNKRDVWFLATEQFKDAHFAVFPEALVDPCIKAGCPPEGVVLDPFAGSGTTGVVALKLGRAFLGIELNGDYVKMARKRIGAVMPLFAGVV